MHFFTTIACALLSLLLIFSGCKVHQSTSPFTALLENSPYKIYTDSIRQFPNNDTLYFRRAILLNSNNHPEAALADFETAWKMAKQEPYAVGAGTILADAKNKKTIPFLQQALAVLPASNLLRIALAQSLNAEDRVEEAILVCNEVLAQNQQQVDVLKLKAALLTKKGDAAASLTLLQQAYQLTPYDIELNYELAFKYAETKNPAVIKLCDSLSKIDTANSHAEPAYYKGIYFANIGNNQAAIEQFNKAIQNDYYYLNAYIEKSRTLFEQKKWDEALKVAQKANTLSPDFADAWYWIGKCKEALHNKAAALSDYQTAFALDKTFLEAKEAADALQKQL
ncbi:MAG: hypothetical protein RIR12_769 [Bacteroidota bacterium]|jgi:tetratricopeptide (TPR) repeat protein